MRAISFTQDIIRESKKLADFYLISYGGGCASQSLMKSLHFVVKGLP